MGRIVSGAMYLATPLAFAAHPAVAKSNVIGIPLPLAEVTDTASIPYVVVTVPAATHLAGERSLSAAIDYEVRRRIASPPTGSGASDILEVEARSDFPDVVADRGSGTFGDAVVATHAERIAFLRQRIDAQRTVGADARIVADLRMRLHRAEAARRLAVARGHVENMAVTDCVTNGQPGCLPTASCSTVRMKIHAAPIRQAKRKTGASPRIVFVAAPRSGQRLTLGIATAKPKPASKVMPGLGPSPRLTLAPHSPEQRLAGARASLAKARSSLATIGDARPAGLLQFPGSDTWSLNRIA